MNLNFLDNLKLLAVPHISFGLDKQGLDLNCVYMGALKDRRDFILNQTYCHSQPLTTSLKRSRRRKGHPELSSQLITSKALLLILIQT